MESILCVALDLANKKETVAISYPEEVMEERHQGRGWGKALPLTWGCFAPLCLSCPDCEMEIV